MNTEHLFFNLPKPYFDKLVEDKKLDNLKAYKDGSYRLIKGDQSILIDLEMFNEYIKQRRIKVGEYKHLVELTNTCVAHLNGEL